MHPDGDQRDNPALAELDRTGYWGTDGRFYRRMPVRELVRLMQQRGVNVTFIPHDRAPEDGNDAAEAEQ